MKFNREHIAFKLITIVLVIALLIPSAIKIAHVFEDHKHEVCIGEKLTHLHEIDLECEFYNFKLNNHYTFSIFDFDIATFENNYLVITSQYFFLSNYQKLHFSLRGPPLNS